MAVGTELIKNGDFAEGETNWIKAVTAPGAAEVSFAEQKAVYQITSVGTLDHHVQLKQSGLKLEQGANYKVNMKLKSTESRTVKVALLDPVNNYAYYGGIDIALNADRQKTISRIITVGEDKDTADTIDFVISMGKIEGVETPVSTIEIDDISIIKVESGTQPDEETEEPVPEANGDTSNEDISNEDTSNPETTEGQNIQPEAEESDEKSEPSASQTDEPQSESDADEEETATAQTTEEENDETNTESVENDSSANQKNS